MTGLCARNLQVLSVRTVPRASTSTRSAAGTMREIVHIQAGQCGNQIGTKVRRPRRGRALGFPAGWSVGLERPRRRADGAARPGAQRLCPAILGSAGEVALQGGVRTACHPCRSLPSPPWWERLPQAQARLEFGSGGREPRPAPTSLGRARRRGGGAPWAPVSDFVSPLPRPTPSFGK